MGLDLRQELRLSQQLILVPQLQLSLKLLQMPRLELEEYLKTELETNPALEEMTHQANKLAQTESGRVYTADGEDAPTESGNGKDKRADGFDDLYLENVLKDSDIRIPSFVGPPPERPNYENTTSQKGDLKDYLLWQLSMLKLEDAVAQAGALIIGNLDENGYLDEDADALAGQFHIDKHHMEEAVKAVQGLDPPGVGARNFKECLMIQLAHAGLKAGTWSRVVNDGLDYVARNDPKGLSKALDMSLREATNAIAVVKTLNPKPGRSYAVDESTYVTPDLAIKKVGQDYEISLNNDGVPYLVLNPIYRMLAQRKDLQTNEKEYVKERIRSALWLLKSIDQRQKTIYKVAQSLVKFQRDFLDHGVGFLKPLTLRDVAREVGVHESTVSRVTSNKYADTPQGVLRLKEFFSTGMITRQGTSISTESIKHDFMAFIENEDKRNPLSDMEIAKHLRAKGINISRRTVAKYREQQNIPAAFQRKQR